MAKGTKGPGSDWPVDPRDEQEAAAKKNGAGTQTGMAFFKPSENEARIARILLSIRDVKVKLRSFEKRVLGNLEADMVAHGHSMIDVDGVQFTSKETTALEVGSLENWRPQKDSSTEILAMLGLKPEDIVDAREESKAAKAKAKAAKSGDAVAPSADETTKPAEATTH